MHVAHYTVYMYTFTRSAVIIIWLLTGMEVSAASLADLVIARYLTRYNTMLLGSLY